MTTNEIVEYVGKLNQLTCKELTNEAIHLSFSKTNLEKRKTEYLCEIDTTRNLDKIKKACKEICKTQEQINELNMQIVLIKNRLSVKVGKE